MSQAILNLTVLLTVTTAVVLLLRLLKQPPIISYILAGIVLGPTGLAITNTIPGLEVLGHLGIAFLLFIVGINLDIKSLKKVGLISVSTGIGQIIFTSLIGYGLARIFGFSVVSAIYIAVALTFSSTIIIVKLLNDRKEIDSLHAKIAMGFLVVQDIVAVLALMFISAFSQAQESVLHVLTTTSLLAVAIFAAAWYASTHILPGLLSYAGKNQEVLFLFSITWCFAIAGLFDAINFSLEIGALLAGLMLASTPYSYEIASKIKPLRDFFITIFFIILGSQLEIATVGSVLIPAIILSLFVLIGNPLIVILIMGVSGFSKRTSFKAGLTVAQISEFGLILINLGLAVGHIQTEVLTLVTLIGLVTILLSTYLILYADTIYERIKHLIPHFQKGTHRSEHKQEHHLAHYDVILFGYNRMGYGIAEHFADKDKKLLIIDFNPEVVLHLQEQEKSAILGDANDAELYEEIRLEHPHIIISTIPEASVNGLILEKTKEINKDCTIILTASHPDDGLWLYERGADYVIIPQLTGGDHATVMLDVLADDLVEFSKHKNKHIEKLKKRQQDS